MFMLQNKLAQFGIVGAILAGVLVWQFVIVPDRAKKQVYTGEIVEIYKEKHRMSRRRDSAFERTRYRYEYYIKIDCDDGRSLEIEIPKRLWDKAEVGMAVKKQEGERWPQLEGVEPARSMSMEDLMNLDTGSPPE